MMKQLGVMLCKEREKLGEIQKNIAIGIISMSDLCRVESGELEIDYFTLQALFERLGKSIDKLELAVSSDEYKSIAYRAKIERSIEEWDHEQLTKQMSDYFKYNDEKRSIHRQYMAAMQAIVWYVKEQDYASCLRGMEQALAHTLRGDWRQRVGRGQHLCNQEIRIILVIMYCQWKLGDASRLPGELEQLCGYILRHYTDTEEQVKVYPHCAWLLGQLYLERDEVDEAYIICKRARKCLTENGSLIPMWEMLELEAACLEKMDRQAELRQCRKYQEAVAFLHEAAGVRLESNMMAAFLKSSFQGEFIITNELVKDLRSARRISQEKLCVDIYTQEALSNIENGKTSPNRRKLYQLLKRLGMERENYYGFIEADDYELYEKVRQYNRCFPKGKWEEAMELLDELEEKLDMTKTVNKQFIGMERVYEQMIRGQLSREQANGQLKELLYLTMPPAKSGEMVYRVPFRVEYMIYNHIAVNLRDDGKVDEALYIYEEMMKRYKKSKAVMRYHAVPGMYLYINYTGFLEVYDELEKAKDIGQEGLRHSIECCRGDMAGDILANLSLVYGKQGLPEVEETYLSYAYYLICLYGRNDIMDILQKAYRDKFHKEIG